MSLPSPTARWNRPGTCWESGDWRRTGRSFTFNPSPVRRIRTGRWKIGSSYSREKAVYRRQRRIPAASESNSLLSLSRARQRKRRSPNWSMLGKTAMSVSQKICHCRISRPYSNTPSLWAMTAEFRTLPLPPAQTASCFSVRPILTFGHPGTGMCKSLVQRAGG